VTEIEGHVYRLATRAFCVILRDEVRASENLDADPIVGLESKAASAWMNWSSSRSYPNDERSAGTFRTLFRIQAGSRQRLRSTVATTSETIVRLAKPRHLHDGDYCEIPTACHHPHGAIRLHAGPGSDDAVPASSGNVSISARHDTWRVDNAGRNSTRLDGGLAWTEPDDRQRNGDAGDRNAGIRYDLHDSL
jgi:hypothetical protein